MNKTIYSVLLALLTGFICNTNVFAQKTEWDFNKDGDKERWVVNRSRWEVNGGKLIIKEFANHNGDPTLTYVFPTADAALNTAEYKYAIISLKNNTLSKKWRFFFYYKNAVETNKVVMLLRNSNLVPSDNQFREYVIDLSKNSTWLDGANKISRIRFDLPDEDSIDNIGENKTLEIDYIKLVKELPKN